MHSMKWYHTLFLSGGALAGAGLLLYFLFKEDEKKAKSQLQEKKVLASDTQEGKKVDVSTVSEQEVLDILQGILDSQEKMKLIIRKLTAEVAKTDFTFNELYLKVCEAMPEDPLEKAGVSMPQFDQLLSKFDDNSVIQNLVAKIMLPSPSPNYEERVAKITCEKVVEIHQFMVEKLRSIAKTFISFPDNAAYDMKAVTIVVQIISAIAVEEKFGYNMEEVETATLSHHIDLASNNEFTVATCEMQAVMGEIVGQMPPPMH